MPARKAPRPADTGATVPVDGFPPIIGASPRVLVLGSLPSRRSLALGQYYGHPRNAFWPIMGELFGASPSLPYDERAGVLVDHGVAVWDVLASSIRPGSLDAAIDADSASANDFGGLFAAHPGIRSVFFNGQAAARFFAKQVACVPQNGCNSRDFRTLPSTSPAHAAMGFDRKLAAWRCVAEAATNDPGE